MNFFTHQDAARKSTKKLVVFFLLAIASLVVLTNLLVMFTMGYLASEEGGDMSTLSNILDWEVFGYISITVVGIILMGSLYKMAQLSGGGSRVAEMLDAQLVTHDGSDLKTKRLLNVVEEMAIASGTPVPPVYVMEEEAINAFAAGYSPGDAIIGVTRGTIEKLNREQLQGVIAHEFSHIINGDMRLNIRLIGILHGILIIGMIGYWILRAGARGSSKKEGGGILFLGIGLLVIGYAGMFFGNMIKSAVSRQREFLADASAVQFTRNPIGIAGALKRIGGDATGSELENPNAVENSHAFFAQGISSFFEGLSATHPPLETRINSIDPNWDGKFDYSTENEKNSAQNETNEKTTKKDRATSLLGAITASQAANLINQTGEPSARHVDHAQALLAGLPDELMQAVREPYTARAVVYLLVIDSDATIREQQLQHLKNNADAGIYEETAKLLKIAESIDPEYRLTLIELALPSLRQLSEQQYLLFKNNLVTLIKMDSKINLFEWSLQKIVFHHLDAAFSPKALFRDKLTTLKKEKANIAILLSALIYADNEQTESPESIINTASEKFDGITITLVDKKDINLSKLNDAIDQLAKLKPLMKPKLLKACACCITSNQNITPVEAELFRAISDALDCPMPPLIAT